VLEVFRGDRVPIDRFDAREIVRGEYGRGFYFVDDPDVAMRYGPVVTPYRVTLRYPFRARQFNFLRDVVALVGQVSPRELAARSRWITAELRRLGFDGVIVDLVTGATYVLAFDPDQIERIEERPPPKIPERTPVRVRARVRGWQPAF
jgi:hypothetical protein